MEKLRDPNLPLDTWEQEYKFLIASVTPSEGCCSCPSLSNLSMMIILMIISEVPVHLWAIELPWEALDKAWRVHLAHNELSKQQLCNKLNFFDLLIPSSHLACYGPATTAEEKQTWAPAITAVGNQTSGLIVLRFMQWSLGRVKVRRPQAAGMGRGNKFKRRSEINGAFSCLLFTLHSFHINSALVLLSPSFSSLKRKKKKILGFQKRKIKYNSS